MYLDHFVFREYPFVLTPNTHYFCNLPHHQEALNVLLFSIRSGEGFIKIVGDVGTGKTMLCRALLNNLSDEYVTAYISNPSLDCAGMRRAIAQELEIVVPRKIDQHSLLNLINNKLLALNREGKKVVVIIDEAQVISDQGMEGLRLLTNLETESTKLFQLVLFGQPELDERLKQPHLRQLKQRIAFSYKLRAITRNEIKVYVNYRLAKAGNKYRSLFSRGAFNLLYRASKGIPRLINILCHKALMATYGQGKLRVSGKAMRMAIKDTESIPLYLRPMAYYVTQGMLFLMLFSIVAVESYLLLRMYL